MFCPAYIVFHFQDIYLGGAATPSIRKQGAES